MTISGTSVHAIGTYSVNSLSSFAAVLGGAGSSIREPERYKLEYSGTIYGRAAVCSVRRYKEGEKPSASSLLVDSKDSNTALMILGDSLQSIEVMEEPKDTDSRFYRFSPISKQ